MPNSPPILHWEADTITEIATVGLTEEEAKEKGYDVQVGKFPYQANGHALTLSESEGNVILVGDKDTGLVLGEQIVCPEVSNLISEIGLAIEMGAKFGDISLTIHAHSTLGEMVMEAADVAMGIGIHTV